MENYQEKIKNISNLLLERAAVYPIRDSAYEKLSVALRNFAENLIDDIDFNGYGYDKTAIQNAMNLSDSPVFICGPMKSGTTLVCNLLDAHPDLLVMPGDSHFVNQMDYWQSAHFKEITSYWVHRIINPTGQEPFWFFGTDETSFKTFIAYLNYFLRESTKNVFICVVMSFYVVQNMQASCPRLKYWVEKTPHNELHAKKLITLFPKAKFIHIIRDPLNNIVSLRKLDGYRGGKNSARNFARVIKKLFKSARINIDRLGKERYLIIKYEELTKNTESVMNEICSFLGIPYNDILLTPTANGLPAVSNSMFQSDRVKGRVLNRNQGQNYEKDYTDVELRDVVTTLYSETLLAGYEWDTKDLLKYKKAGVAYVIHLIRDALWEVFPTVF